jgi:hypothetical protein
LNISVDQPILAVVYIIRNYKPLFSKLQKSMADIENKCIEDGGEINEVHCEFCLFRTCYSLLWTFCYTQTNRILHDSKVNPPLSSRYSRPTLIHVALFICLVTILYNIAEGIISILFGSETSSVSLLFFGIDSFVEVISAVMVAWRFWADVGDKKVLSLERERKVTLGVGGLMFLLALGTVIASVIALTMRESPETTLPGIIISVASISLMVTLWLVKRWLARVLDSSAMKSDAKCSLSCLQLSVVLFVGSLVSKFVPVAWWIDSAAALLLTVLFVKEGVEMIRYARSEKFNGGCGCSH